MRKRSVNGVFRKLTNPYEGEIFIAIEVPDSVYELKIVAVSEDRTKITDPELAKGPDWYTTDVHDEYDCMIYR